MIYWFLELMERSMSLIMCIEVIIEWSRRIKDLDIVY